MEINEKLDIFYRAAIAAADERSQTLLQEYKKTCGDGLLEYEKSRQEQRETAEHIAEEKVKRAINRKVSEEILRLKKEYHRRQEEKKSELFALVETKLADYRQGEAYERLLLRKIAQAATLAGGEEFAVYLDPADAPRRERLERESGCALLISETSLGGGIRAVIPSKNILMDESFLGKLEEEREKFSF